MIVGGEGCEDRTTANDDTNTVSRIDHYDDADIVCSMCVKYQLSLPMESVKLKL